MDTKQAKDFLVEQTAKQAALENVPLSDLEKRIMYFTESEDAAEDPIALNGEFEEQFDSDEFEVKISRLLQHAHKRVRTEDPQTARQWKDSVRFLEKGDHYILVLLTRQSSQERPPYDSLKLLGAGIVLAVLFGGFVALLAHFGIQLPSASRSWSGPPEGTRSSLPSWIQHSLLALMLGSYVCYLILLWLSKKRPLWIGQLWLKRIPHKSKRNSAK
jgi:hypothetical protein